MTKFLVSYDDVTQTLPPVVKAKLDATYAALWQPLTAYALGARVVNPAGDLVTAKAAFTSGAAYVPANWNLSASYALAGSAGATDTTVSAIISQPLTKAALDAAYIPISAATTTPVTPALGSSWVSFDGGATFSLPNYRLMYGAVWCGGFMKFGATGVVFTLPVGMRPLKTLFFNTNANAGIAQLGVKANGDVSFMGFLAGGSNASVSLNGVQFPAEQ